MRSRLADSLRRLGHALGQHVGAPGPIHLDSWATAVDALLNLGGERPTVVVLDDAPIRHGTRPLLPIGEAKWGERLGLGLGQLARLDQARELLRTRPSLDAQTTRIVLASGTGFSADLRRAAEDRPEVILVDPDRMYHGD